MENVLAVLGFIATIVAYLVVFTLTIVVFWGVGLLIAEVLKAVYG